MKRTNVIRRDRGLVVADSIDLRDPDRIYDVKSLRNISETIELYDDFFDITDGNIWVKQDTSAAGASVWALAADTHGGELAMTLSASAEA